MAARGATFDIGHPAPHRGRIRLGLLMLGLAGAPLAWAVQVMIIYGFASDLCAGNGAPPSWVSLVLPVVNLVGLVTAALALALSYAHLRETREEHGHQSGGMMDAGEGRTRFLAIWGVWASILFMLAIAFNTLAVFWAGLCEG